MAGPSGGVRWPAAGEAGDPRNTLLSPPTWCLSPLRQGPSLGNQNPDGCTELAASSLRPGWAAASDPTHRPQSLG